VDALAGRAAQFAGIRNSLTGGSRNALKSHTGNSSPEREW
jgi:hypothetical protein